jgi:hypothetical protein
MLFCAGVRAASNRKNWEASQLLLGATIVLRERLLVLGNLGDFGFTRKAFS